MFLEADTELDKIDPFNRAAPEVLAIRLAIYHGLKKWELMQTVAKKMALYEVMKRKVKRTPRRSMLGPRQGQKMAADAESGKTPPRQSA